MRVRREVRRRLVVGVGVWMRGKNMIENKAVSFSVLHMFLMEKEWRKVFAALFVEVTLIATVENFNVVSVVANVSDAVRE